MKKTILEALPAVPAGLLCFWIGGKNNFPVCCLSLRESGNFRGAKGDNYSGRQKRYSCGSQSGTNGLTVKPRSSAWP
jgi:hypothetical protein